MKEVCGFIDNNGVFHKTEKECEIADTKIAIREVKGKLENFHTTLSDYIIRSHGFRLSMEFQRNQDEILNIVAKTILLNSNDFIEIINKKEELSKHLDALRKSYAEKTWKPWYLRIKWW